MLRCSIAKYNDSIATFKGSITAGPAKRLRRNMSRP